MNASATSPISGLRAPRGSSRPHAQRTTSRRMACITALCCSAACLPTARAVDGCEALLCLAAPDWRSIPQCVPTIQQLFRDLSRGRHFPGCPMGGPGNSASHAWAQAPSNCPPQYTQVIEGPSHPIYRCEFAGSVSVTVNGTAFARTWWRQDGDSVTEFSPAAKAQLGLATTRFDQDLAAWLAAQPAVASAVEQP